MDSGLGSARDHGKTPGDGKGLQPTEMSGRRILALHQQRSSAFMPLELPNGMRLQMHSDIQRKHTLKRREPRAPLASCFLCRWWGHVAGSCVVTRYVDP